jgi:HK97 family phage major capsid protein
VGSNPLLDRLLADYQQTFAAYDAVCERASLECRDITDAEAGQLEDLRGVLDPLGERIMQLREVQDRKDAVTAMMTGSTVAQPGGLVHINSEPELYRPPHDAGGQGLVFFRDLLHATVDHDPDCRARIERHAAQMRALGTSTTGAGVVPPTWLFEEFAATAHGARPWADAIRRIAITDANPVNIGKAVAPGATVAAQVNQGDAPSDGSFNANLITTQPSTYTGKVDVSRQLVDGSNPAIDSLVYADAMGAYNEQIEQAVVNAFEAATGFAATITYPGSPAYVNLFDAFIDAAASVNKHRKMPAQVVFCSIGAFAYLLKVKDQQGRPLMTTGSSGGPFNAYGQAEAPQVVTGVAGEAVGLAIVPSWAGVDNHVYVAKHDDLLLLESSTFNFRYEEVLGPESIRLGVWGYAAPVVARYPVAIAKIDAGTTIPAPQETGAAAPAGSGGNPGRAPQPPRR